MPIFLLVLLCFSLAGVAEAQTVQVGRTNWIEQGNRDTERRDLVAALQDYTHAIQQAPDEPVAWYDRALTLFRLDRVDEAIGDARHSVAVKATFADGFYLLAHLLQLQGKLAEAESAATRAVLLRPDRADLLLRRADIRLDLNRDGDAARDLDAVLAIEPKNPTALYDMAGVRLRQNRENDAIVLAKAFLAASPEAAGDDITVALASLLLKSRAFGEALAYLDAHPSDRPRAVLVRARALDGLGRHEEATHLLVGATGPQSSHVLGELFFAQARCADAEAAFLRATSDPKTDASGWNDLAAASLCARDFPSAARASARATALAPESSRAFRYRASALRGTGDISGAVAAAHRALELGGDDPHLRMMVGIDEYTIGSKRVGYADYKRGCEALTDRTSADARACAVQLPKMRPRT